MKNNHHILSPFLLALLLCDCSSTEVIDTGITFGKETVKASQRRQERTNPSFRDDKVNSDDVANGLLNTIIKSVNN
ncbi:hypothetical protein Ssed_0474 [Shewanella sediminis HAW-EB3]|uniref:Uncharacterized protein n=1 Tax=Shewanella sediminis (strain HAW-EB3) TaxID=425104 RepID=A8FQG4_SHESH|nr:hypothetical protein [Shewanella sediminis]ABV35087.1 hypothetical protein Ssed_0474 [Shewanella sediminis HAW-EB3]